ncbi:hypothetical protein ALP53_200004 [Pseudomonas savastanoi pv. phaseolicola]|nr:hypothetical protein ALP53_200004 [Pseudomonas savastanoi pv. phaseolicola]
MSGSSLKYQRRYEDQVQELKVVLRQQTTP